MSKVSQIAWAAQRADEEKRKKAELKLAEERGRKADRELKARVKKRRHLFDDSILPKLFPDAEWSITNAVVRDGVPTVFVHEVGDDNLRFRVTADGVFIDYEAVTYTYGGHESRTAAHLKVETALDVGRYLKIMSDQLDESYRRNPD